MGGRYGWQGTGDEQWKSDACPGTDHHNYNHNGDVLNAEESSGIFLFRLKPEHQFQPGEQCDRIAEYEYRVRGCEESGCQFDHKAEESNEFGRYRRDQEGVFAQKV